MEETQIKVASFNINGIHNPIKRWKILSKLKKDKVQIAMLQESHLDDSEHTKLNKMGFKHVYFSSHSSGRRRGVAILISGVLNYEHIVEHKDSEGRFILIIGKIDGVLITLINVYAPPGSDWSFYKFIFELLTTKSQGLMICAGDFNVRLNPKLDSSNGKSNSKRTSERIKNMINELGIVDVWRDRNPNSREYTHYSSSYDIYSRIDYFFMFKNDVSRIKNCEFGPGTISDHNPIFMSLALTRKSRSTLWRFNSNLLNSTIIKEKIKKEINRYLEENDNGEVGPPILWDALKSVIRGKIIAISSNEKKIRQQKMKELEEELKELQKEHSKNQKKATKTKIKELKKELDELSTQDIQKKLLFTKQKYYEAGSKSQKLLAFKLRKQQADRTIHKIHNPLTKSLETGLENIHKCFTNFYQTLYSQPKLNNENQIDAFLSHLSLPSVTSEQNKQLISEITEKELRAAIGKLKGGKSPGTDGFTTEWYKEMQDQLVPTLLRAMNFILERKIIPPSWRDAVISVIPKEGKDKLICGNYRPVSVLNIDYKLFTAIISRRLENILPEIIHKDQTGFIRQRQTQDNIRKTLHILNHAAQERLETLVLSLDAEKAFDSVRWTFLYKVMSKFGFHQTLIDVIAALYNKPTAKIKINGDLSDSFILERGTRQGCCVSPLLFALFIEPLSQWIRQSSSITGVLMKSGEQKLSLFADDLLLTITNPTQTLPALMELINEYGSMSGYKININKTQVLTLNYSPPIEIRNQYTWNWEADSIKYLGVLLTKDLSRICDANFGPLTLQIKTDIQRWTIIPFFNLYSRIDSIRMNILPRLLYLFQCLPVEIPEKQFVEWDRLISQYVWQGRRARVRYKTLQLKKEKGGLGLPNLQDYYLAAQLRPLICLCSPLYEAGWKDVEGTTVEGVPMLSVLMDKDLQEHLNIPQDSMFLTILSSWRKVIKLCRLGNQIKILRWCAFDSAFKPNRMDGRFKGWVSRGLTTYLTFTQKGVFRSFEELQRSHGLEKGDFYRYLQVRTYFNQNIKENWETNDSEFLNVFISLLKLGHCTKVISKLYNGILGSKQGDTDHIRNKWEKEGDILISTERWENIFKLQWMTSSSNTWREFCWKSIVRFFVTPAQKKHLKGGDTCWRFCGTRNANHHHIFWSCCRIKPFWEQLCEHLNNIFSENIPFKFEALYLGDISFDNWTVKDKKLLAMLLAASKKTITRKWLKPETPKIEEWIDIVQDIYNLERLSYTLKGQRESFFRIWSKWTNYVKQVVFVI